MRTQEVRKLLLSFSLVASVMYFTGGFSILGIHFGGIFQVEDSFLRVYSEQLYLLLLLSATMGLALGRVFCGWLCPITAIMNLTSVFGERTEIDPRTKYAIYAFTALALYLSYEGWLSLSSEAIKMSFILLLLLIIVFSFMFSRFFCTHLCPLGAHFSLLGLFRIFRLNVGEECRGCRKCNQVCEMGIDVMNSKPMYECSLCWNCVKACPYKAIKLRFILSLI